jgi:hypothetical protein
MRTRTGVRTGIVLTRAGDALLVGWCPAAAVLIPAGLVDAVLLAARLWVAAVPTAGLLLHAWLVGAERWR